MHPAGIHNPSCNYCLPGHTWLLIPPPNYLEVLPARLKSPVFHNFGVRSEESVRIMHNNFAAYKYLFSDQRGSKFVIYNPPITCISEYFIQVKHSQDSDKPLLKMLWYVSCVFLTLTQYLIFVCSSLQFSSFKTIGTLFVFIFLFTSVLFFYCVTFIPFISSDSTIACMPPFSFCQFCEIHIY